MQDPVVTEGGHTYERTEIVAWFEHHGTDPKTNQTLSSKKLVENVALRSMALEWMGAHPEERSKPKRRREKPNA